MIESSGKEKFTCQVSSAPAGARLTRNIIEDDTPFNPVDGMRKVPDGSKLQVGSSVRIGLVYISHSVQLGESV